jgi:hypothetical protein
LPRPLRERFLKHLGDLLRPLLDVTDVAVELALGEARRRLGERGRCGTPDSVAEKLMPPPLTFSPVAGAKGLVHSTFEPRRALPSMSPKMRYISNPQVAGPNPAPA